MLFYIIRISKKSQYGNAAILLKFPYQPFDYIPKSRSFDYYKSYMPHFTDEIMKTGLTSKCNSFFFFYLKIQKILLSVSRQKTDVIYKGSNISLISCFFFPATILTKVSGIISRVCGKIFVLQYLYN